jgi:hypothetical protein
LVGRPSKSRATTTKHIPQEGKCMRGQQSSRPGYQCYIDGTHMCLCVCVCVCVLFMMHMCHLCAGFSTAAPHSFFYSQPLSSKGASYDITIHLELRFARDIVYGYLKIFCALYFGMTNSCLSASGQDNSISKNL